MRSNSGAAEPSPELSLDPDGRPRSNGVTELRIHGVGGTPPELILDNPHLKRVSGDDLVGFYRPAQDGPDKPTHQEACSWGKITAASASQALWLLLLPFALANLAGWTHPSVPGKTNPDEATAERKIKTLVRLFGVSVTVGFVLAISNVVLDLFAFQCGSLVECVESRWWLTMLKGLQDRPAGRLTIGILVCFLILQLLAWASRASYQTLETFASDDPLKPPGGEPGDSTTQRDPHPADVNLAHPDFWRGNGPVGKLRDLHMAAGVATLATLAGLATGRFAEPGPSRGIDSGIAVVGVLLLGVASWFVAQPDTYRREELPNPQQFTPLKKAAYGLIFLVLVNGALSEGQAVSQTRLEVLDWPNQIFFATQAILLLAMFQIHLQQRHSVTRPIPEPAFQGFGAFAVCSMALFLLTSVWAGGVVRMADSLGVPAVEGVREGLTFCQEGQTNQTDDFGAPVLCYAPYHQKTAIVAFVVLTALLIVGVRLTYWMRGQGRVNFDAVIDDLRKGGQGKPDIDHPATRKRVESIARSYGLPQLVLDSDSLLLRVVLIGTGVALMQHFLILAPPVRRWFEVPEGGPQTRIVVAVLVAMVCLTASVLITLRGGRTLHLYLVMALILLVSVLSLAMVRVPTLINTASWLMTLLPLLLSVGFYTALRNPKLRRGVGAAWDVVTFWPRHFHPFAPPCYGERLVPQLRHRIEYLTGAQPGAPKGRVLLSAHSQGTVVAAAAIQQVSDEAAQRMALFTYGSPIEILYHRIFPAYFGPGTVKAIAAKLSPGSIEHPWQHFYCRTDPLGIRLSELASASDIDAEIQIEPLSPRPNTQLLDPYPWAGIAGEPPGKMGRHSAYLAQKQFHQRTALTVEALLASLEE